MRSPLTYCGGKGHIAEWILGYVPPHDVWVEDFCGGASVFFHKPPSKLEVLNDLYMDLINFYRVLRNPRLCDKLNLALQLTPFSRAEWRRCKGLLNGKGGSKVERARAFFTLARQSFGGVIGRSWRYAITGTTNPVQGWRNAIARLPEVHERLINAQIECLPFEQCIKKYDQPGTLHYLDPPYVSETRTDKSIYVHEMNLKDHERLVGILLEYPEMAMLSGYRHEVHAPLEDAGWVREEIEIATPAKARTRLTGYRGKDAKAMQTRQVECLWINPAAVSARDTGQGMLFHKEK